MFWLGRSLTLNLCKGLIRLQFPSVRRVTTAEFVQRWKDLDSSQLVILDARGEAEYAVSHLEAARRIEPAMSDGTIAEVLEGTSKDTAIVVYCSVGYRSAKVAQQLEQLGFRVVFNLEGGLFQWVNEGRPIVRDGQPTQWVHPYNAMWGLLVKRRDRLREK